MHLNALLVVPSLGTNGLDGLALFLEEGFGQGRALVGQDRLFTNQMDAARLAQFGQRSAQLGP